MLCLFLFPFFEECSYVFFHSLKNLIYHLIRFFAVFSSFFYKEPLTFQLKKRKAPESSSERTRAPPKARNPSVRGLTFLIGNCKGNGAFSFQNVFHHLESFSFVELESFSFEQLSSYQESHWQNCNRKKKGGTSK